MIKIYMFDPPPLVDQRYDLDPNNIAKSERTIPSLCKRIDQDIIYGENKV